MSQLSSLIHITAKAIWETFLTTKGLYNHSGRWGRDGEILTFMEPRFMAVSVWLVISECSAAILFGLVLAPGQGDSLPLLLSPKNVLAYFSSAFLCFSFWENKDENLDGSPAWVIGFKVRGGRERGNGIEGNLRTCVCVKELGSVFPGRGISHLSMRNWNIVCFWKCIQTLCWTFE